MSPHLCNEIANAAQNETLHAHHRQDDEHAIAGSRRRVSRRLGQTITALGVCVAAATAVAVGGAHANSGPGQAPHRVSATQLEHELAALEAKGYMQASCTVGGTLMVDQRTGQSVTVRW